MPEPLQLDRAFGRQAFGADAANYDAARPAYPGWVFEALRDVCGVRAGSHVFEIGAGTGKATGPLLALGAAPLVAIEPDARLADFLRAAFPGSALDVTTQTFEDVELEAGAFDLGLSATAFHWLHEGPALSKIAHSLRAGGWWAALWNNFGDGAYPDLFHLATQEVLAGPASPGEWQRGIPFGLDAGPHRGDRRHRRVRAGALLHQSLATGADRRSDRSALCHLFQRHRAAERRRRPG